MLRIGVILLAIGFFGQCSARSLEHGKLIERIKRSPHYWEPEPPPPHRPYWPPPPYGPRSYWPPPPPPPPFWHHHHHGPGPAYQQDNDDHPEPQDPRTLQQSKDDKGPQDPSTLQQSKDDKGPQDLRIPKDEQPVPPLQQNETKKEQPKESCNTCKGENSAVSRSESVNGDAISISITRTNKNK